MQPDLSRLLRAMVNQTIIRHTDQHLQPERRNLLEEGDKLISDIEEELGAGHETVVYLKKQQDFARSQIDDDEGKEVTQPYHVRLRIFETPEQITDDPDDEDWEDLDEEADEDEGEDEGEEEDPSSKDQADGERDNTEDDTKEDPISAVAPVDED